MFAGCALPPVWTFLGFHTPCHPHAWYSWLEEYQGQVWERDSAFGNTKSEGAFPYLVLTHQGDVRTPQDCCIEERFKLCHAFLDYIGYRDLYWWSILAAMTFLKSSGDDASVFIEHVWPLHIDHLRGNKNLNIDICNSRSASCWEDPICF